MARNKLIDRLAIYIAHHPQAHWLNKRKGKISQKEKVLLVVNSITSSEHTTLSDILDSPGVNYTSQGTKIDIPWEDTNL